MTPEIELVLSDDGKELTITDKTVLTSGGYDYQINTRVFTILNLYDRRTVTIDLDDAENAALLASWIGVDRKVVLNSTHLGFTLSSSSILPDAVWFVKYEVNAGLLSKVALTFNEAAVADNVTDIDLEDADGVPSEYVLAFNDYANHNAFLADIATELAFHSTVDTAVVTDAGVETDDDRVIVLTPVAGQIIDVTGAVITGGASQPTITIAPYSATPATYNIQNTLIGFTNGEYCTNKCTAKLPTSDSEEIKKKEIIKAFTAEMYKVGAIACYNNSEYNRAQILLNRMYKVCSHVDLTII